MGVLVDDIAAYRRIKAWLREETVRVRDVAWDTELSTSQHNTRSNGKRPEVEEAEAAQLLKQLEEEEMRCHLMQQQL